MINNPIQAFWGVALNSLELGNFFKTKFTNFQILDPDVLVGKPPAAPKPITAQVYFGTPRTAFLANATANGKALLPMVNYHLSNADRDPSNAYEPINSILVDRTAYDQATRTYPCMAFPSRFLLTYNVSLWGNSYKEVLSMVHALIQPFVRGETHVKWWPDKAAHPEAFLLMKLTWDGSWSDDTELEGLDPKETRSVVKYTLTMTMEAKVPKGYKNVPVVVPFELSSAPGEKPVKGHGGIWLEQVVNGGLSKTTIAAEVGGK